MNEGNLTEAKLRAGAGLPAGNTDGKAFIGLALSCNGRDFSYLIDVFASSGREGRTVDQPVDGLLVHRGGQHVSILVHRDVHGISQNAPESSRIVRRELNRSALEALAEEVWPTLMGCDNP